MYHDYLSKIFVSHITKTFRGTIQCFMIFGYQKNLFLRSDFHDFLQKKTVLSQYRESS